MTINLDEGETRDPVEAVVRLVLHETRTPLNAICGFVDLLLAGAGGPLSAQSLDYIEQVADAARRLERGLDHLQEIARGTRRSRGRARKPGVRSRAGSMR